MKYPGSFLFLFILFTGSDSYAQDFKINQLKLEFNTENNQLYITYNIDSKRAGDKFLISVIISRQNGELINPESVTGDVGDNIRSGNYKRIIWDTGKDSLLLDEDISVEVTGEKVVKSLNKSTLMLSSAGLPGLGQTKITGKPWWLGGVAAYGALAGSIILHKASLNTYDEYLLADNISTRAELYDKCEKEWFLSTGLVAAAAAVWAANIVWIAIAPGRNNPEKHVTIYLKPAILSDEVRTMASLRVNF